MKTTFTIIGSSSQQAKPLITSVSRRKIIEPVEKHLKKYEFYHNKTLFVPHFPWETKT